MHFFRNDCKKSSRWFRVTGNSKLKIQALQHRFFGLLASRFGNWISRHLQKLIELYHYSYETETVKFSSLKLLFSSYKNQYFWVISFVFDLTGCKRQTQHILSVCPSTAECKKKETTSNCVLSQRYTFMLLYCCMCYVGLLYARRRPSIWRKVAAACGFYSTVQ